MKPSATLGNRTIAGFVASALPASVYTKWRVYVHKDDIVPWRSITEERRAADALKYLRNLNYDESWVEGFDEVRGWEVIK